MKKDCTLLIALAGIAFGGFLFYLYNGKKKTTKIGIPADEIPVEKINGVIKLENLVSWFKSLSIDSTNQMPFIVGGTRIHEVIDSFKEPQSEATVLAGIFDERTNELSLLRFFSGKALKGWSVM